MTERLKVVFGSLSELTDGLAATADRLEEHLSELDTALLQLQQSWSGEANDLFGRRFGQWQATSRDLRRSLRGLHRLTATAHGNYTAAEDANLRIWGTA